MISSKDGYALVTGASSGIGYELAKLFARDGKNVVVVARRQDRLEELKHEVEAKHETTVIVLPKDLSSPQCSTRDILRAPGEGHRSRCARQQRRLRCIRPVPRYGPG